MSRNEPKINTAGPELSFWSGVLQLQDVHVRNSCREASLFHRLGCIRFSTSQYGGARTLCISRRPDLIRAAAVRVHPYTGEGVGVGVAHNVDECTHQLHMEGITRRGL